MTFQIHALPEAPFQHYFELSDAALEEIGARRVMAVEGGGYPCRVSLEDAVPGEELVLVNYRHVAGNTPFAASHAIFVRKGVRQVQVAPGDVPEMLRTRLLSVRGFDADHLMLDADVVEGTGLAARLDEMFSNPEIAEVHIHAAKQGCFAARATRG